jgi:hypothetical protein
VHQGEIDAHNVSVGGCGSSMMMMMMMPCLTFDWPL